MALNASPQVVYPRSNLTNNLWFFFEWATRAKGRNKFCVASAIALLSTSNLSQYTLGYLAATKPRFKLRNIKEEFNQDITLLKREPSSKTIVDLLKASTKEIIFKIRSLQIHIF